MAPAAGAAPDLELKHPKVVRGVRVAGVIGGVCGFIVGEIFVCEGSLVGKHVSGAVVDGGDTAGEELPWWDINVSQGFLEREKMLVGGLKLEFVF